LPLAVPMPPPRFHFTSKSNAAPGT